MITKNKDIVRKTGTAAAICMMALCTVPPANAQSNEQILKRMEQLEGELKSLKGQLEKKAEKTDKPASGEIPAGVTHSGSKNVELTISGQVDRGVLYTSDGAKSGFQQVDNDHSSSRVRWLGKARFDKEWTAGTQIEVDFRQNSTAVVDQNTSAGGTGNSPSSFRVRKTEAYFDSTRFGRVWVGFGDPATETTTEQTLAGTDLVSYSGSRDTAAGYIFRSSVGGKAVKGPGGLTGPTISNTFDELDGITRANRIRYDTPTFQGLQFSASALGDGAWDGAAFYHAKFFDQFEVVAAGGYAVPTSNISGVSDRLGGSASVLHTPTGISLSGAIGRDTFDSGSTTRHNDRSFRFFQVGWQHDFFDFGRTYFALDFFEGSNQAKDGDYSHFIGGAVVQHVRKIATDFYLSARNFSYDQSAANFEDIQAVLTGARVKF